MFFRNSLYGIIIVATILFTSCNNEFRQVQRSKDTDLKFEYAMRMFEEGRYSRAVQIFEQIQPFMRQSPRFGDMTFTLAQAYLNTRDYFMAATVFRNYARLFSSSPRAEEAFFMSAYCMMLDVPFYKLDQTSAHDAIKEFQLFINYYSLSPRVEKANEYIDLLRLQLARKAFALANNYYRRSMYNAASISFRNVMRDFPETHFREQAMFMNVKSLFYYANNSIRSRQVERFTATIEAFEQFQRSYPESPHLAQLQTYVNRSNRIINRHKANTNQ